MENTSFVNENTRAGLYLQYQNSNVCFEGIRNSHWSVSSCLVFGYSIINGDYGKIKMKDVTALELKHINNISDDDAYEMALFNRDLGDNKERKDLIEHSKKNIQYNEAIGSLRAHHFDFLRMRGYAVPYLNLSVGKMIELGWIKLK